MANKLTFVEQEWSRQPTYTVGVNKSHPLASSIVDIIDGSEYPPRSVVCNTPAENFSAFPERGIYKHGVGIWQNATCGWQFKRTDNKYAFGGDSTVLFVGQFDSASGQYAGLYSLAYNSGGDEFVSFRYMNTNDLRMYVGGIAVDLLGTTPQVFSGAPSILAVTIKSGSNVSLYKDGALLKSEPTSAVAIGGANSRFVLFGEREALGTYTTKGRCALAVIFNKVLSSAEIQSLSNNPWQIFELEEIPLFVPAGTGPVTHPTSGDVVGNTATVTGSALRETGAQTHLSTGDVVGNTATISGTALRYRAHATTGVVAGLTSNVTGTAKRYRLHTTTGAATGLTSTVTGSAVNEPAAGVHEATGDVVAGTGSVSGTARHIGVHSTTGVLTGFSAEVIGAAQRSGAVIVHDTSGVLAGYDSVVTGAATNQGSMTLTPADIQAIVAAIKAEVMPVNIVRVNGGNVDGDGSDSNPWGPV